MVTIRVGNEATSAMIDTGSTFSLVAESFLRALPFRVHTRPAPSVILEQLEGGVSTPVGRCNLSFSMGQTRFFHEFFIIKKPITNVIIGTDFLEKHRVNINFHTKALEFPTQ